MEGQSNAERALHRNTTANLWVVETKDRGRFSLNPLSRVLLQRLLLPPHREMLVCQEVLECPSIQAIP